MRLNSLQFAACTSQAAISVPASYHYSRDSLVALYNRDAPTSAVADTVRTLGISCVCRLRCIDQRRRVTVSRLSSDHSVRGLFIGSYRGCRDGSDRRPPVVLRPVGNGAAIITGNRPIVNVESSSPRSESFLHFVHVDRHSAPPGNKLVFGCLNVRSLGNKLDDLLDVRRAQSLDIM